MDSGHKCWLFLSFSGWPQAGDSPDVIFYQAGLAITVLKRKSSGLFHFTCSFCCGLCSNLGMPNSGQSFLINVCSAVLWDEATQNIPICQGQRGRGRNQVWGCPTQSMLVFRDLSWSFLRKEKLSPGPSEEVSLSHCRDNGGYLIIFHNNSSLPLSHTGLLKQCCNTWKRIYESR